MLRHGIMPPKEIVRPESARIASQGIQSKGIGEDGMATLPVGQTIKSMFPFYLERTRLGGELRDEALEEEELTNRDLEFVNLDVREHADKIYQDIFDRSEERRVGKECRFWCALWMKGREEYVL